MARSLALGGLLLIAALSPLSVQADLPPGPPDLLAFDMRFDDGSLDTDGYGNLVVVCFAALNDLRAAAMYSGTLSSPTTDQIDLSMTVTEYIWNNPNQEWDYQSNLGTSTESVQYAGSSSVSGVFVHEFQALAIGDLYKVDFTMAHWDGATINGGSPAYTDSQTRTAHIYKQETCDRGGNGGNGGTGGTGTWCGGPNAPTGAVAYAYSFAPSSVPCSNGLTTPTGLGALCPLTKPGNGHIAYNGLGGCATALAVGWGHTCPTIPGSYCYSGTGSGAVGNSLFPLGAGEMQGQVAGLGYTDACFFQTAANSCSMGPTGHRDVPHAKTSLPNCSTVTVTGWFPVGIAVAAVDNEPNC